ncbi:hypothetical protein D9758_011003 [Tetrapyrgos nigripes]|uniref:Uncharacterized protein n=1 Tax=Tetrapyrgos nigripes TaxID=182062 RepID=A0A8H5GHT5_9AGAR|nr:hypothetical protein D9758_011003 [Tetrapyrgos nigripes]
MANPTPTAPVDVLQDNEQRPAHQTPRTKTYDTGPFLIGLVPFQRCYPGVLELGSRWLARIGEALGGYGVIDTVCVGGSHIPTGHALSILYILSQLTLSVGARRVVFLPGSRLSRATYYLRFRRHEYTDNEIEEVARFLVGRMTDVYWYSRSFDGLRSLVRWLGLAVQGWTARNSLFYLSGFDLADLKVSSIQHPAFPTSLSLLSRVSSNLGNLASLAVYFKNMPLSSCPLLALHILR